MARDETTRKLVQHFRNENRVPLVALSISSDMSTFTLSEFERGAAMREELCDRVELAVYAMQEIIDASQFPVDWRRTRELKPEIDERIARLRRERSAELHRQFEAC